MSNLLQFPDRKDEFEDSEADNLVVNLSELVGEWQMESILLALFEVASENEDLDAVNLLMPSVGPLLKKFGLTNSESEV